jgi:hypothetical protein
MTTGSCLDFLLNQGPVSPWTSLCKWLWDRPYKGIQTAPTFEPSDKEWSDPLAYIATLPQTAQEAGFIKIRPPSSWASPCVLDSRVSKTSPSYSKSLLFKRIHCKTLLKHSLLFLQKFGLKARFTAVAKDWSSLKALQNRVWVSWFRPSECVWRDSWAFWRISCGRGLDHDGLSK